MKKIVFEGLRGGYPKGLGCCQCDGSDDNASIATWCKMDGVDEIAFCDYFDTDPMEELCYGCWHMMRDEFEGEQEDRASFQGGVCGDAFCESKKRTRKSVKEEVAAELTTSGSKTWVSKVKTSNGKVFSAQDAGNLARGATDVNKFGDPKAAEEAGNIYNAASKVAKSVAHNLDKDPTKISGDAAKRRTIATKFGKDSTDSWDIQASDSKAIKDGQFLMNADAGDEKGIMTMKGDTLVQIKGNLDKKNEAAKRLHKRIIKEGVMSEILIDIEDALSNEGISADSTLSIDDFELAAQITQDVLANGGLDPNMANEILADNLNILCESKKERVNRKTLKESITEDYGEPLGITIENAVNDTGIVFGNYDEDEGTVYVYLRDDDDPIATINWDVGFFDVNTGDCEVNFFAYDYKTGNTICTLASTIEEVAKAVADHATFIMSVGR